LVVVDVLRKVGAGEAALVGHDEEKVVLEPRRDLAPGAVRFGEAVEQDHRGVLGIAGQRDVQRHAGAQGESVNFRHLMYCANMMRKPSGVRTGISRQPQGLSFGSARISVPRATNSRCNASTSGVAMNAN